VLAVRDDAPAAFVDAELERRRTFGSPPYGRLVKLTVALEEHEEAEKEALAMVARLRERSVELAQPVTVLGPVPAYIARRAGRWRFHVVIRGDDAVAVLGADPGPPWSVDVDPDSLL
jgi:primosomal protein N' (replication factor Y)